MFLGSMKHSKEKESRVKYNTTKEQILHLTCFRLIAVAGHCLFQFLLPQVEF